MNLWCTTFTTPRAFARQTLATDRRPSRRHARSSSVVIAGGTAGLALALTGAAAADDEPCLMSSPPTLQQCFTCWQWQLEESEGYESEITRQACFEGANEFYRQCLEQYWGPNSATFAPPPSEANDVLTTGIVIDLRSITSFSLRLPDGVGDTLRARALMQYASGGEIVRVPLGVDATTIEGSDFAYTIEIDAPARPDTDRSDVAIVVIAEGAKDGEVQYAYAFRAPLVDPFDLNEDGAFDHADRVEAVRRFAAGELSKDRLDAILAAAATSRP
jgi:hypothetical protein